MTTNTEPPADVKRLIQKAKFEVAALHNEGRPELAQFIARMGEALLSAQPAPSQSGLVFDLENWPERKDKSKSTWAIDDLMREAAKALRTNNQPAPDDGLAGKVADEIARRGPDILRGHNRADLRAILSALTAKDHTALLSEVMGALHPFGCDETIEQLGDDDDEWAKFRFIARDYKRAAKALTRIDQALATKGDGE